MNLGFDRDLYIQPFDHRGSFQVKLFGWKGALTDAPEIARRYTEFVHIFEKACAS
jgi:hypothetical protein